MATASTASTTYTLRMKAGQKQLIREYASMHGSTMAEFMLAATMDRIEDEIDLSDWDEAKAAHDADPATYTLAEVESMLA